MNIKELKKKFKKEFDDYVVKIDMPHISQKGLAVELKEYNKKVWSWIEKQLKAKDDEVLKKVENLDKEMVDGVGWNRMHELALDILDSLKGKRRAIK